MAFIKVRFLLPQWMISHSHAKAWLQLIGMRHWSLPIFEKKVWSHRKKNFIQDTVSTHAGMWTSLDAFVYGLFGYCEEDKKEKRRRAIHIWMYGCHNQRKEEGELALALVKHGYGELHLHHPCRAHCWGYSVSTINSSATAAMETFKKEQ